MRFILILALKHLLYNLTNLDILLNITFGVSTICFAYHFL